MPDPSTLASGLTYTGTLAVALLMFLFQLTSFAILLAFVGTVRLLAYAVRTITPQAAQANGTAEGLIDTLPVRI
ncbi:hypothetical protein PSET11_02455 [Arthrobacter ulcerisalmonis]|uniref:Uncharacterized protein n=1 Tax=Arthrobacter ulcerisalmonis TaxID=2483813 RepID=A0A3P5XNI9_9MICC|nr:hypothetical protein [Arthrobacter ulcerisalmonis]VDC30295.1 hypothetical protein PSET11_02455 [Arthrobacter ulcerisalmonis]